MSLKDLFFDISRLGTTTTASAPNIKKITDDVESENYALEVTKNKDRFIPPIDYSNPENFAKYGSAQDYYSKAIENIYSYYPYDGSLKEKEAWFNSSSYLDIYIFENEYPRTNGFISMSAGGWGVQSSVASGYGLPETQEFIQFKSGPHKKTIWDTTKDREGNLKFDLSTGTTVEFWINKEGFPSGKTQKEVIFDLWNGKHYKEHDYGRLRIELSSSSGAPAHDAVFRITAMSGTSGFWQAPIDETTTESSMTSAGWTHYAFALKNSGSNVAVEMYKNGSYTTTVFTGSTLGNVTGSLIANIGALRTVVSGTTAATGSGKLAAGLDEFRYWKTRRTSRDIGRYYISQVGGGSNTDDSNTDLGLYFKFNEGIVGSASFDSTVLDYSGRLSNGTWTGYNTSSRYTGSAMVLSGKTSFEFKDPIIYKQHPEVITYKTLKTTVGEEHDADNVNSFYKSFPTWITEENEEAGGELKKLTQIMSSYFDELHNQIETLNHIKNRTYPSSSSKSDAITGSIKPSPFSRRLLTSTGFTVPELFFDSTILETFESRDESIKYADKIYNVKNLIYQNIYNNLNYLLKTKGTNDSIRNVLRSYGANEDTVNMNVYGQNIDYEIRKNKTLKTERKKVFNFHRRSRTGASVYQYKDYTGTQSYISGSNIDDSLSVPNTVEAEMFFPNAPSVYSERNYSFPDLTSSLFGQHTVDTALAENDLTWTASNRDYASFQVYAVRDRLGSKDAFFVLTGSIIEPIVTPLYKNVYTGQKWNFAVRMLPSSAFGSLVQSGSEGYKVEFYGVTQNLGDIKNEFSLSSSITVASGTSFLSSAKRLYAGAHRTNFTGSLDKRTDVKLSYLRFWLSDVDNDIMREHAMSMHGYGQETPIRNSAFTQVGLNRDSSLANVEVPFIKTQVLNWSFDNVSSSADSSGRVQVDDFSSGSADGDSNIPYGWIGTRASQNYTGRADFFESNAPDAAINEYVFTTRNKLPESFYTEDMISVGEDTDKIFTKETRPVKYFFSIENSLYRVVSEEMLNIFGTMLDFNNLIGEPVNRYRQEYKAMNKLKSLFFEKVENEPDAEAYFHYFRHVDTFIDQMLNQLMPASAEVSDTALNIIESHILERSKYQHKFPSMESKEEIPVAPIQGVGEATVKYNFFQAPVPENPASLPSESKNYQFWHELADRGGAAITSGDATIDSQRNTFKRIINTVVSGSTYATRKLSPPYKFSTENDKSLKGGVELHSNNLNEFSRATLKFNDPETYIKIPFNTKKENKKKGDPRPPELIKERVEVSAITYEKGETSIAYDYKDGKANLFLPFTIFSSSVATGYIGSLEGSYSASFENMHLDRVGTNASLPMQGPFTEKYVGGHQHRHAPLNYSSSTRPLDSPTTRAEGWYLKTPIPAGTSVSLLSESFSATDPVGWTNVGSTATGPSGWILTHSGPTPSSGTGPDAAFDGSYYAYAETSTPNHPGSYFGLVTPKLDADDVAGPDFSASFYYHMYGINVGNLRVQHSQDPTFGAGVTDLTVNWNGSAATFIAGQQQGASGDPYRQATIDLTSYAGTEFYLRFLYQGGITYLSDVAIDAIEVSGTTSGSTFKLLDPAFDEADAMRAVYYRNEVAKRPLNIRNIRMTTGSTTVIGNYSNNYEVVNTPGRNVNNIWFVQNSGEVTGSSTVSSFISASYDFSLKDRSTLKDGSKNKTVIVERFSAPGGAEVMSRGFLDVASETYSVYNCMNYRNSTVRNNLNLWNKHHSIFGGTSSYGTPLLTTGSFHKVQRNTGLRIEWEGNVALTGSEATMNVITASYYDNGFVSHQIPQSDSGYAWISGSITGSVI